MDRRIENLRKAWESTENRLNHLIDGLELCATAAEVERKEESIRILNEIAHQQYGFMMNMERGIQMSETKEEKIKRLNESIKKGDYKPNKDDIAEAIIRKETEDKARESKKGGKNGDYKH